MRRTIISLSLLGVALAILLGAGPPSSFPAAQNGATTLVANTVTAIPAAPLDGRWSLLIQNLNSTEAWCGYTVGTTSTLLGIKVPGNAGSIQMDLGYSGSSGLVQVYCLSTASQTSTTNLRWAEVR